MFSDMLKRQLEQEVVGQPRAVDRLVRAVTLARSGIPRQGPLGIFLFMGPSGTGKTHLARVLTRTLHGEESRLVVADMASGIESSPWASIIGQIAPLFALPGPTPAAPAAAPPMSVVLLEQLEKARPEVVRRLAMVLETGQFLLPDRRRASLHNTFVIMTSNLCERQILDEGHGIGFRADSDENERRRVFEACFDAASKQWGADFLGRLDDFIIFHRLDEASLEAILDRHLERLTAFLAARGIGLEVLGPARRFLLGKGSQDARCGARLLVRAVTWHLEFPIADLLASGRLLPQMRVVVDHREADKHLHFVVPEEGAVHVPGPGEPVGRPIAVRWDDAALA